MCARIASIAVGGYYPTPASQIPLIAALLEPPPARSEPRYYRGAPTVAVLDPCAGDGAALESLCIALAGERLVAKAAHARVDFAFYTCEMEASRHALLEARLRQQQGQRLGHGWQDSKRALRGDAFRLSWRDGRAGVGLLLLNPPYDTDRVYGRLEEKFLSRFWAALAVRGVLVFIVPHYALAASAETLGRHFTKLTCRRFTDAEYGAYKQVVLFATRSEVDLFEPDQEIVRQVEAWAADAATISPLSEFDGADYPLPESSSSSDALAGWTMRELDAYGLVAKFAPWHETTRRAGLAPVARVLPDTPVAELMHRVYEVAMPPRPAHIAAGIAAGLFNGQRIEPDDPTTKLPPLLVKGVFDREWRDIEEKKNKDGETTGVVQVQQPKLVVTILDLEKHAYHTLPSTIEASKGATTVDQMGIADLLRYYGTALMGVMERQCQIIYDPRTDADTVYLAASARPLFAAQAHAVRAGVTLLRTRPGVYPQILGEIGSGKSIVALMTAKTHGAWRLLIIAPPHLVTKSWPDEISATTPEAQIFLLENVAAVQALAQWVADNPEKPFVAILSREAAKLGHAWAGVAGACPRCAMPTHRQPEELAKKRACCGAQRRLPADSYARAAYALALQVRPYLPTNPAVRNVLCGPLDERYAATEDPLPYWGVPDELALRLRVQLAADYIGGEKGDEMKRALVWLQVAAPDDEALLKLSVVTRSSSPYGEHFNESLLSLLPPTDPRAAALADTFPAETYYGASTPSARVAATRAELLEGKADEVAGLKVTWADGQLLVDGVEPRSVEASARLLACITQLGKWRRTPPCGEPLHQAIPEPRRYPLAKYIVKKYKHLFDFLIVDESHEYATDGSAQERAGHRLTSLKLPTVLMTGTVMNGYAHSLFSNMWVSSPAFRAEFDKTDGGAFEDRYGYRKRLLTDRDAEGEIITFGSQTDRVERTARDVGAAPGVLPLFLFRHLLPIAVTIHKADLRIDLPACTQERVQLEVASGMRGEYNKLVAALRARIAADRFSEDGLAGKLFGALAELPSYLDRATDDVGNGGDGAFEIRYPESVGGELVASAKLWPASTILPKEAWLLRRLAVELAEGRNVMVFAWHLGLLPRLSRLIAEQLGEPAPILWADKVPTGKRQAWIDKEIIKKRRRVMVANPVCIQTGLNNLVHFSTQIWHENPACNPTIYRQAVGRVDRIGQKRPTRILFGHYGATLQEQMYDLLIAKVAISTATDGLDPESALRAAGIAEEATFTGLSIGKQLWAMMTAEDDGVAQRRAVNRR